MFSRSFPSNHLKKLASYSCFLALAAGLSAFVPLAGCGDDHHSETMPSANSCGMPADTFSVGMKKATAAGKMNVMLMSATPNPPTKGDNTWMIHVTDAAGMAVDGATIKVTPFMPEHGHGSSIDVMVTPKGSGGEYTLDPVNFSMPGVWETTMDITTSTGDTDSVKFSFCIEG